MHGADSHHGGGDHSYGHQGGHMPGQDHHGVAGGGDHHGPQSSHDFSLAHIGDGLGHAGFAVEGVVFMGAINYLDNHAGPGFHYSFSNGTFNVHQDNHYRVDGANIGGLGGLRGRRRVLGNPTITTPVNELKAAENSSIFIVHAHNIGFPDLNDLFHIWPEKYGFVDITNYPGNAGVKEKKKGGCFSWDWFNPLGGPLPPGRLPGVVANSERNKRIFQLGKINPRLPWWRRMQIYLGLGHPPRRGELISDIHQNCVTESYDNEWEYDATGTAEAKIEFRVKGNKRYYRGVAPFSGWLFTRRGIAPHWSIVWDPYEAHLAATLALAKRMHKELSEFKRVPGKLEAYVEMLKKLPDGGGYTPPPEAPDGVTPGTGEDEREMDEWEVEQARKADRTTDSQLPTTTAPLPTTPATPVTPPANVDGLPDAPLSDTGAAVDLPAPTTYNPAPPAPVPATELAPSAPGYVTADLGLPARAPMPETQYQKGLDSSPVKTVDSSGAVEVHVNYTDFPDYHGHHA